MRFPRLARVDCSCATLLLCACASMRERALERVVVIGASMSAGFALDVEVGRAVSLSDVLDRMLIAPHAPVANFSNLYFFMQPGTIGSEMAAKAAAARPTLVTALDFLFWYGYGFVRDEEERLGRLEEGLRTLEAFQCRVIVGDLPDMSESIGKMLAAGQVPSPPMRARLNRRIAQWTQERGATVVPLSEIVEKLRSGGEIRAGTRTYAGADSQALLQGDRLHPTLEGLACVAILALDRFMKGEAGGYLTDPKAVASLVARSGVAISAQVSPSNGR